MDKEVITNPAKPSTSVQTVHSSEKLVACAGKHFSSELLQKPVFN